MSDFTKCYAQTDCGERSYTNLVEFNENVTSFMLLANISADCARQLLSYF